MIFLKTKIGYFSGFLHFLHHVTLTKYNLQWSRILSQLHFTAGFTAPPSPNFASFRAVPYEPNNKLVSFSNTEGEAALTSVSAFECRASRLVGYRGCDGMEFSFICSTVKCSTKRTGFGLPKRGDPSWRIKIAMACLRITVWD